MPQTGRRTLLLSLALVLAIAVGILFGYRAGRHARMFRRENQPVRSWMSVPFIAHTHHVPAEVLYHAIGADPQPKDHRPLRRLAHEQHRPVEQLVQEVNRALQKNGVQLRSEPPENKKH